MRTYWIILISISTLISTPNVPICKFKHQIMSDYYADHLLFDHCALYSCQSCNVVSSVGRAADHHVTGPGFNTHSQLNLAGG